MARGPAMMGIFHAMSIEPCIIDIITIIIIICVVPDPKPLTNQVAGFVPTIV